jgi:hypothetical protein
MKNSIIRLMYVAVCSLLVLGSVIIVKAAYSPGLGAATNFVVLASTYTNVASGTTLNGSLGYTTGPAFIPTVNGTTFVADATYNQAGNDQAATLSGLDSQACGNGSTIPGYTFTSGAIDLATDNSQGTPGVYTPGVYCINGAAAIGGGNAITLNGSGTYIFRMTGALNTSANSRVNLTNGASECNIWWTPAQATTLGANSTFKGTDIDASGITIGSSVVWAGRALAFGGTISTNSDTISAVNCLANAVSPTPTVLVTTTVRITNVVPGLPKTDTIDR